MQYNAGSEIIEVTPGMFVERDALRVVEAIRAYDPNLDVICLDPSRAEGISDHPYIVVEKCNDGQLRPVCRAWKLDDELIARVQAADCQRRDVMEDILNAERNFKLNNERRYKEWREEVADQVKHIAGMKSKYTVRDSNTGDLITFYDDRPATRTPL